MLRSTATLACVGRRRDYFREEFLSALDIVARGDVKPDRLIGSWAGAFGPTQFMPTTFKRFAVDFDHDGRRDVVDSVADVMASTANNLKTDGWVSGESWGYEVVLPANFNYLLAERSRQMTIGQWEAMGIARAGDKPFPRAVGQSIFAAARRRPRTGFPDAGEFPRHHEIQSGGSVRARHRPPGRPAARRRAVRAGWPRDERALSMAERFEMQQLLAQRGFDIGEPDGLLGPRTRIAIRNFQSATGQVPDGFASSLVLDRLRQP